MQQDVHRPDQTGRNLKLRYREHILYIKNNDPPSPLMHCTCCKTYMNMVPSKITMSLLKPSHKTSMLIPYEQLQNPYFPLKRKPHPRTKLWRTNPTISVSYRLLPYVTTCPLPHLPHDPHKPVLTKPRCNLT